MKLLEVDGLSILLVTTNMFPFNVDLHPICNLFSALQVNLSPSQFYLAHFSLFLIKLCLQFGSFDFLNSIQIWWSWGINNSIAKYFGILLDISLSPSFLRQRGSLLSLCLIKFEGCNILILMVVNMTLACRLVGSSLRRHSRLRDGRHTWFVLRRIILSGFHVLIELHWLACP